MTAITEQRPGSDVAVSEQTARKFAETLMSGKSELALAIAAHKGSASEQEANVAGIVAGAKILTGREESAVIGQAVACYVLTHGTEKTPAYMSLGEVAEAIGRSKGRVSQLASEGALITRLGLPEGWQGASVTREQIRRIASGAGSKDLRALVEGKSADSTKRKAIAKLVEQQEAKAAEAKAKAQQQRDAEKAIREASRTKAPKSEGQATEQAPTVLTADQLGTAVSTFEDVASVLLAHQLTPSQARVVRGIVAQLAAKFTEPIGVPTPAEVEKAGKGK